MLQKARLVLVAVALSALEGCGGCGGELAPLDVPDARSDATAAEGSTPSPEAATGSDAMDAPPDAPSNPDAGAGSVDAQPGAMLACLSGQEDASGPCPPAPPMVGSPCDVPSYYCEYGSNWWSRCDLILTCTKGAWEILNGDCPDNDGGPAGGACPADTCPATWAEAIAIDGGPCPAFACQYPEGDCLCGPGNGSGCYAPTGWSCLPAASGCPYPRPRFGTPCVGDGGICAMGWGPCCNQAMGCNDGIWTGYPLGEPCMM
jgi:hypothetical protein